MPDTPAPATPASSADRPQLLRALLAAADALCAGQQIPKPCLLMVATPIGNLADVGLRTLAWLQHCDLVAAEDTRAAQRLLRAWGLELPLLRADRHREQAAAQSVLAELQAGRRVAFVSDAGTPAIRDPGALLARAARAAGFPVLALPGPSAVTAALSASGLELDDGYVFAGYVPATAGRRTQFLREMLGQPRTAVCFETPHRLLQTLQELHALAATRRLVLAKELTKQFERQLSGSAEELLDWLQRDPAHGRGEFVLMIAADPRAGEGELGPEARRWALRLAQELPASRACAVVGEVCGVPRRELYGWLLRQGVQAAPGEDGSS